MVPRSGSRVRVQGVRTPPPPHPTERDPDNWYSAKYADMYDMYFQQFT